MNKLIPIGGLAVLAIALFFLFNPSGGPGQYDGFAQCLTEKGVKMYGAYWCSHCKNQKELFGSSFQYVQYIECDVNGQQSPACTQAGVTGYPTWIFSDGNKVAGELSFEKLSAYSGCSLTHNATK